MNVADGDIHHVTRNNNGNACERRLESARRGGAGVSVVRNRDGTASPPLRFRPAVVLSCKICGVFPEAVVAPWPRIHIQACFCRYFFHPTIIYKRQQPLSL